MSERGGQSWKPHAPGSAVVTSNNEQDGVTTAWLARPTADGLRLRISEKVRELIALNGLTPESPTEAAGDLSGNRGSRSAIERPSGGSKEKKAAPRETADAASFTDTRKGNVGFEEGIPATAGHLARSRALPDGAVGAARSPHVIDPGSWMPRPSPEFGKVASTAVTTGWGEDMVKAADASPGAGRAIGEADE